MPLRGQQRKPRVVATADESVVLATMRQSDADDYIWIVEPTVDYRATFQVGAARFGEAKEWAIGEYHNHGASKLKWCNVSPGHWELRGVLS